MLKSWLSSEFSILNQSIESGQNLVRCWCGTASIPALVFKHSWGHGSCSHLAVDVHPLDFIPVISSHFSSHFSTLRQVRGWWANAAQSPPTESTGLHSGAAAGCVAPRSLPQEPKLSVATGRDLPFGIAPPFSVGLECWGNWIVPPFHPMPPIRIIWRGSNGSRFRQYGLTTFGLVLSTTTIQVWMAMDGNRW